MKLTNGSESGPCAIAAPKAPVMEIAINPRTAKMITTGVSKTSVWIRVNILQEDEFIVFNRFSQAIK